MLLGLQVTRDFLRTLQRCTTSATTMNTQGFFVRLNMGTRYFMYVPAQIVNVAGDQVQCARFDSGHRLPVSISDYHGTYQVPG